MIQKIMYPLGMCLRLLAAQGVAQVRVESTNEILSLDAATALIEQDGTAGSLAYSIDPSEHRYQYRTGWLGLLPKTIVVPEPGHLFEIGDPDVLRFSYGWDPTLAQCLDLLEKQGVARVRVAVTDEIISVHAARARLEQDGSASAPASLTLPCTQESLIDGAWWQWPSSLRVSIPGHIIQLQEGGGWSARFYYGDREGH